MIQDSFKTFFRADSVQLEDLSSLRSPDHFINAMHAEDSLPDRQLLKFNKWLTVGLCRILHSTQHQ